MFVTLVVLTSFAPLTLATAQLLSNTNANSILEKISAPAVRQCIMFTLTQASLTAILVMTLSPFAACGLFCLPAALRRTSLIIGSTMFCLPSVVIASGLIVAWGNNGLFTITLQKAGIYLPLSEILYSPYAIVLVNVMMNISFCSGILFRHLLAIPETQLQSASIMGISNKTIRRKLLWPAIKPALFYFGGLTFLLSMGSFGALSVLGGGPNSRTIELSIYQAIYYDADWQLAGLMAILHTLLCGTLATAILVLHTGSFLGATLSVTDKNKFFYLREILGGSKFHKNSQATVRIIFDIFLVSPIIGTAWQSITSKWATAKFPQLGPISDAFFVSMSLALPAAVIVSTATWLIVRAYFRYTKYGPKTLATAMAAAALSSSLVPPMALAFGFLAIGTWLDVDLIRYPAAIVCLTASILPFLLAMFMPLYASRLTASDQSRLLLGLPERTFIKKVEWPAIRTPLLSVFAVSFGLCINESSIVSMLGDPTKPALTTVMIRLTNHYRFSESAFIACSLIASTFVVVYFSKRSESVDHG